MKNIRIFYLKNCHFFGGKIFSVFEQACFRNDLRKCAGSQLSVFYRKIYGIVLQCRYFTTEPTKCFYSVPVWGFQTKMG